VLYSNSHSPWAENSGRRAKSFGAFGIPIDHKKS
jgi:hypothetical protein